ncbi:hypothetical protein ACM6XY_003620 [Vibrio parahaemolyticus]|nr:hypothetical protein [Vibrio parahaemolyticus]
MSGLIVENLRLKELITVLDLNKPFFEEFRVFLSLQGYPSIFSFISEKNEMKLRNVLVSYFNHSFRGITLFDGIGRPYNDSVSKWYFITWILRDAPKQRLDPIVQQADGVSLIERRINTIIQVHKFVAPLLPLPEQWEWSAISEVMLQRLEGSRRALKGGLFEAIVRDKLKVVFKENSLPLTITPKEVKINDETYDVEVKSVSGKRILFPVKTRETMGGGHSLLFTRDIHKAISVAEDHAHMCIPIIIAESWVGNLNELRCKKHIFIQENPNQLDRINPKLDIALRDLIPEYLSVC